MGKAEKEPRVRPGTTTRATRKTTIKSPPPEVASPLSDLSELPYTPPSTPAPGTVPITPKFVADLLDGDNDVEIPSDTESKVITTFPTDREITVDDADHDIDMISSPTSKVGSPNPDRDNVAHAKAVVELAKLTTHECIVKYVSGKVNRNTLGDGNGSPTGAGASSRKDGEPPALGSNREVLEFARSSSPAQHDDSDLSSDSVELLPSPVIEDGKGKQLDSATLNRGTSDINAATAGLKGKAVVKSASQYTVLDSEDHILKAADARSVEQRNAIADENVDSEAYDSPADSVELMASPVMPAKVTKGKRLVNSMVDRRISDTRVALGMDVEGSSTQASIDEFEKWKKIKNNHIPKYQVEIMEFFNKLPKLRFVSAVTNEYNKIISDYVTIETNAIPFQVAGPGNKKLLNRLARLMIARDTAHLINFATIGNPRELLIGSTTAKDKYIRLKTPDGTKGAAARFFLNGTTTFSNLNIRHAQSHEITILPYEPAFNRGLSSVGAVYDLEIVSIPVYVGQGVPFKTYKPKDSEDQPSSSQGSFNISSTPVKSARSANVRSSKSILTYNDKVPMYDARTQGLNLKSYKTLPPYNDVLELGNHKSVVVIFTVNCYAYDKDKKFPFVSSKLNTSLSLNILSVIVIDDGLNVTLHKDDIAHYRIDDEWRFLGVDISKRDKSDDGEISLPVDNDTFAAEEGNEVLADDDVFM